MKVQEKFFKIADTGRFSPSVQRSVKGSNAFCLRMSMAVVLWALCLFSYGQTYTIHAGFGDVWAYETYGTISPLGDSTVEAGNSITYHFYPNAGYHTGSVTLGGVEKIQDVAGDSLVVSNITQDDTLWVLFAVDKNNTIAKTDILYWVGTGSNEVIFAVNWCEPEIAFAWGYRFNGSSVSLKTVMDDIKTADPRFDYLASFYVDEITYKDSTYDLTAMSFWGYNINEEIVGADPASQQIYPNDVIEFGDTYCGLLDDFWLNVWTTTIIPVSVPSTTGIVSHQDLDSRFSVYPNPTTGELRIENAELKIENVEIYDVYGRKIVNCQLSIDNSIDVSHLATGLYFLKAGNKTVKIVKE